VDPVTVVVSRHVKPGREDDYEAWIRGVTEVALRFEGHLGMNVFRPKSPSDPYVLVYKFDSGAHLDAWLHSPVRAQWVAQAEQMTTGTQVEHVSGLESWFTLPGTQTRSPPKWKMAVVTGALVFAMGQTLGAGVHHLVDGRWPPWAVALLTTALMVSLLTWLVMPAATRALRGWLFGAR
jgi:hypothetical protein